ncbi:protein of unknown function [Methylacidimicrobium sp. AP8]|uniref:hypothetical protein n=1 Tax=Methylacidimicrobium sp. AP8 TaxID=2730359 RepID=UPI0018C06CA0|nr:hypothetical protein [Methylacidimicrobium sp. AP8]CAB4243579.1 protein of unknown function [Methylacidimicrobium sp. AP8]
MRNGRSHLCLAFVAFSAVRDAAALLSRSRHDASRFLWQGIALAAAAGWGKTGQSLEHWLLELGAMLEGGFQEIGGHRRHDPSSRLR